MMRLPRTLIELFGLGLFIGMMAVGYYYNLTFIQLGLVDLGERGLGLSKAQVAAQMSVLAVVTCVTALACGVWMSRRGIGFVHKLRIAFGVILSQTLLTWLVQSITTPVQFGAWIVACSLALGIGVPATFGLAVDLVPVRRRGIAAALITASAYLGANLVPAAWTIEAFSAPLLWLMPAGVVGLGVLAFAPLPFVVDLARQHARPAFSIGRYTRQAPRRFVIFIVLMFGVFFVDSLGFLRLLDAPRFMEGAWQSAEIDPRLFIGITHVVAALIGGILYDALDVRELFYWIFGIFALTHLMYTFSVRSDLNNAPLAMPMLYATAVSLYTVVNFALWADLSTSRTIGRNVALGVAFSGWTATFLSTALSIWWQTGGMSLERHLNIVDSLAMVFFLGLIVLGLRPKHPEASESSVEIS
jgi:MFS family permease